MTVHMRAKCNTLQNSDISSHGASNFSKVSLPVYISVAMFKSGISVVNGLAKHTNRRLLSSSTPLKVYGFPLSQPVRSVLLLCQAAGIKYDFVLVDALKGQNLKPDFKAIHPAGLLPAIEEEGLGVLGECSAIMIYLAESRCLTDWYPTDPVIRARINFWMSWNHGNTRVCTSGILRNKMFPPRTGGGEELVATGHKTLKASLAYMEIQLQRTKYLVAGEKPTIADLVILTELDQHSPEAFNFVDLTPYPAVVRWMGDVAASVPTYQTVFEPVRVMAAAAAARAAKK